jgi:hypothetical protein
MLLIEHIQALKGFFTMQKASIEKNGESEILFISVW